MLIWLFQRAEPTPHDVPTERLYRTGLIAGALADSGHQVEWWTSGFNHYRHYHRYLSETRVEVSPRYHITYVPTIAYVKNISFRRFVSTLIFNINLRKSLAKRRDVPDLVLVSIPAVEVLDSIFALKALNRNVKIVIDIRDQWPDHFDDVLKRYQRILAMPVCRHLRNLNRKYFSKVDGVVGLTSEFVNWAVAYAGAGFSGKTRVFPLAYGAGNVCIDGAKEVSNPLLKRLSPLREGGVLTVVFAGAVGLNASLFQVVNAIKRLNDEGLAVMLVIAGDGDQLPNLRRTIGAASNIHTLGRIDSHDLKVLLSNSDIGLLPYLDSKNYRENFPNKPAEYLTHGLPLALSLSTGVMKDFIDNHRCGFSYHGSEDFLKGMLKDLIINPDKLERLQTNARRVDPELLNGNRVYPRYVKFLEEIAEDG